MAVPPERNPDCFWGPVPVDEWTFAKKLRMMNEQAGFERWVCPLGNMYASGCKSHEIRRRNKGRVPPTIVMLHIREINNSRKIKKFCSFILSIALTGWGLIYSTNASPGTTTSG
jgi:hypothetical protein